MTHPRGHTRTTRADLRAEPGWYVQWGEDGEWRKVGADFAAWVVDLLIDGERLVYIETTLEEVG